MVKTVFALVTAAALVVVGAAFAAQGATNAKGTTVNVTAGKPSELRFTISKKRVAKGVVTFKVTNRGALEHDFKINGKVTKLLPSGKSTVLKVTFKKARKYAFICTVPGHAAAGMKGVLVVK